MTEGDFQIVGPSDATQDSDKERQEDVDSSEGTEDRLGHLFPGSTEPIVLVIRVASCAGTGIVNPALPYSYCHREQPIDHQGNVEVSSVAVSEVLHRKEDCNIS